QPDAGLDPRRVAVAGDDERDRRRRSRRRHLDPPPTVGPRYVPAGIETEPADVELQRSVLVRHGHAHGVHVGDPYPAPVAHLVLLISSVLRGVRRSSDMRLIGHLSCWAGGWAQI